MERLCDLHTHSTFSDGTCTPEELIALAEAAGLSAVALCDHNTVAGLPDFLNAARGREVEAVPGIEFSTDYEETELHILGLFIRPEHYPDITQLLEEPIARKEQSSIALVSALRQAGIELDYDTIRARTAGGLVNRAVIGAEMVRLGYCQTLKEAFSRWLSPKQGYYTPPRRLDAFTVIRFLRAIGAAAVLAHPFLNLNEERLRVFLQKAKTAGLSGMEVYYPLFDELQTRLAGSLAEEFGVAISGGSDFHGTNKPDIAIGRGKGSLAVPDAVLKQLKKCV